MIQYYVDMSNKIKYKTYEEVADIPVQQYTTIKNGKVIEIKVKNPAEHTSNHPLDNEPTFFYNLEQIILHPHRTITKKSNNPKAIKNRKKGKVVTYVRDNFVSELNIPGYINWKGDETRVVTMYGYLGDNYTETYYIIKK